MSRHHKPVVEVVRDGTDNGPPPPPATTLEDESMLDGVVLDVGATHAEAVPVVGGRVPAAVLEGGANSMLHGYSEVR